MSQYSSRFGVFFVWCFFVSMPVSALTNCNNTIPITGNTTLGDDYISTSGSNPCFEVTQPNVTLILNGRTLICDQDPCGTAIKISAANVTVRNGYIEGAWAVGVENGGSGGVAHSTILRKLLIDGAAMGVFAPGALTIGSVLKNITDYCFATYLLYMPPGGQIEEVYCQSEGHGFFIGGSNSGNDATYFRNYIRAATSGITILGGAATIERNIVSDASTSISITGGSTVTLIKNLCAGANCDEPDDSTFTVNVNW